MRPSIITAVLSVLLVVTHAAPVGLIDMLIEKFNESLSTHMREKLEPILRKRRTCHCQLVMMPPPMPWYHQHLQKEHKIIVPVSVPVTPPAPPMPLQHTVKHVHIIQTLPGPPNRQGLESF